MERNVHGVLAEHRKDPHLMFRHMLIGMTAGAAGTVALNVATYLDMAIRGRPSSDVPAQTAEKIAAGAGVPLEGGTPPADPKEREQREESRKQGLGALMGYVAGIGVGTLYGLIRPFFGEVPLPISTLVLGVAAMAAGDLPPVMLGVTDPRTWGRSGWVADVVPHLACGLVATATYDAINRGRTRSR